MDNRGIDSDPGWVNRKLRDIERNIEAIRSERRFRNLPTTSATANMVVDAITGVVSRSTSSSRYKQDIADLDLNVADILKMRPRTWLDKSDVAKNPTRAPRYVGFVAEELHAAGLGVFVGYDTNGNPESVSYDRLTVALLIAVRFLYERIVTVQGRATTLENQGTTLAGRVKTLETAATDSDKKIAALQATATDSAQKITALQSAVAGMEKRLAALESSATPTPPPSEPTP